MEDFIDSRWIDAIDIGFNESIAINAPKIVKECEKNNYTALSEEAFEELMTL